MKIVELSEDKEIVKKTTKNPKEFIVLIKLHLVNLLLITLACRLKSIFLL